MRFFASFWYVPNSSGGESGWGRQQMHHLWLMGLLSVNFWHILEQCLQWSRCYYYYIILLSSSFSVKILRHLSNKQVRSQILKIILITYIGMNSSLKIIKIISKKKISKPTLLICNLRLSSLNKFLRSEFHFINESALWLYYRGGIALYNALPKIHYWKVSTSIWGVHYIVHSPSQYGGDIYVCSSSSTMYQQHSNVKILEWQQQQQQCFLCNEKQLLNGTELWI